LVVFEVGDDVEGRFVGEVVALEVDFTDTFFGEVVLEGFAS
jgi:hypothetical protein